MGDAALLAVRMEGGAAVQGYGASRSWKRQEPVLPGASGGTGPAQRDLAPVRLPKLQQQQEANIGSLHAMPHSAQPRESCVLSGGSEHLRRKNTVKMGTALSPLLSPARCKDC